MSTYGETNFMKIAKAIKDKEGMSWDRAKLEARRRSQRGGNGATMKLDFYKEQMLRLILDSVDMIVVYAKGIEEYAEGLKKYLTDEKVRSIVSDENLAKFSGEMTTYQS